MSSRARAAARLWPVCDAFMPCLHAPVCDPSTARRAQARAQPARATARRCACARSQHRVPLFPDRGRLGHLGHGQELGARLARRRRGGAGCAPRARGALRAIPAAIPAGPRAVHAERPALPPAATRHLRVAEIEPLGPTEAAASAGMADRAALWSEEWPRRLAFFAVNSDACSCDGDRCAAHTFDPRLRARFARLPVQGVLDGALPTTLSDRPLRPLPPFNPRACTASPT